MYLRLPLQTASQAFKQSGRLGLRSVACMAEARGTRADAHGFAFSSGGKNLTRPVSIS